MDNTETDNAETDNAETDNAEMDNVETEALKHLAARFDELSACFTREAEHKLTLARSMHDEQAAVREHIKIEVMRAARKMFAGSYREATGQRGLVVDG